MDSFGGVSQLSRALVILRYLQRVRRGSFGELLELLSPISRTTLSTLLSELEAQGEIKHIGRDYIPSRGVLSPEDIQFYELPHRVRAESQKILGSAAQESQHACAIFARVGSMTMKIVDQYNLPDGDWRFSPVGYEWPLVPFHGFAKVFLAHSEKHVAEACFYRWKCHLKPELVPHSWEEFSAQLGRIRRKGYALEYQEETAAILRLAVPVREPGQSPIRFVVGFVARNIYLLEAEDCLKALTRTAEVLSGVLGEV